jgi:hypothetical protein
MDRNEFITYRECMRIISDIFIVLNNCINTDDFRYNNNKYYRHILHSIDHLFDDEYYINTRKYRFAKVIRRFSELCRFKVLHNKSNESIKMLLSDMTDCIDRQLIYKHVVLRFLNEFDERITYMDVKNPVIINNIIRGFKNIDISRLFN